MMIFLRQHTNAHTFFCDTVHHWAKHQDVCAAVGASSQAAVAAKTCGAKHRQATDTLMTTRHILCYLYTHTHTIYTPRLIENMSEIAIWTPVCELFCQRKELLPASDWKSTVILQVHWACMCWVCGGLTARTRAGVKVGKEWIQLIWTEQGVPAKLCCGCCRGQNITTRVQCIVTIYKYISQVLISRGSC